MCDCVQTLSAALVSLEENPFQFGVRKIFLAREQMPADVAGSTGERANAPIAVTLVTLSVLGEEGGNEDASSSASSISVIPCAIAIARTGYTTLLS